MSLVPLNLLNFFMADVKDGLGPFLGVFLQGHGWTVDQIGLVMTIGGLVAMLLTTPMGILVDVIKAKRAIIIFAALAMVVACGFNYFLPTFSTTMVAQILAAIAGASIPPAIAGITLGLVGPTRFDYQLGQNESYNHGGNAFSAMMAGVFSYYYGLAAVFALMGLWAILSIFCVLFIKPQQIDYDQARGLNNKQHPPMAVSVLFTNKGLIVLAITVVFFHLANAAMLPLLSQAMVFRGTAGNPGAYTALTVIVAQITMIPMALLAAKFAVTKGYGLVFSLALCALPIRGILAGLIQHPYVLIPVQILDGVGAGLMGVAVPGLVARILRGSGRFNTGLALILTVQGIGAALSHSLAGMIAKYINYEGAFLALSLVAVIGLLIWLAALPFIASYNTKVVV